MHLSRLAAQWVASMAVCASAFAADGLAVKPYPERQLTAAQAHADVALLRQALEDIHPGLYRYSSKGVMDQSFDRLETSIKDGSTDVRLYGAISVLLASIRCDHTKAELPDVLTEWRKANASHLPFRFRVFEGRMFVVSSDPQQPNLPRGTEVLAINGTPVSVLIEKISSAISVDGFTDHAKPYKLAADSDLMGSDFDQFHPIFFGFSPHYDLQVVEPGSAVARSVRMMPVRFDQWLALAWPTRPYRDEFYKSVNWRIAGQTAILRIDTFVNYRNPVEPARFLAGFFSQLQGSGVNHLIIDLRANGGGSSDAILALTALLLDRPFTFSAPTWRKTLSVSGNLRPHIETWGDPAEIFEAPPAQFRRLPGGMYEAALANSEEGALPTQAAADRFSGKVTLLISPVNASGSTRLIAKLRDEQRVTLIGQDTGGSAEGPTAGRIFFLKLPNSGIVVRVPNMWNRTNLQTFDAGRGVAPDVRVPDTLQDWLSGKDAVMDAALKRPVNPGE
jgi:hypothetical protein